MKRFYWTVFLLFMSGSCAQAADDGLAAAILNCSAQQGDAAQLACYNQIAAQLKGSAPMAVPSVAPAPTVAATSPPPPPASAPAADFGKETLPAWTSGPNASESDSITAHVTAVAYDPYRRFTVTLDNGQVWQQSPSDDMKAHFRTQDSITVTILRGMLTSYHLYVLGATGSYIVKRVQ
ncbi:MAG: hypothetical protein JO167_05210 [Alphaproteobacteria bacterium]|nr:hypothetical protein [Alphaproteobacteria bacterium]